MHLVFDTRKPRSSVRVGLRPPTHTREIGPGPWSVGEGAWLKVRKKNVCTV
jgi:hypothetical protein